MSSIMLSFELVFAPCGGEICMNPLYAAIYDCNLSAEALEYRCYE